MKRFIAALMTLSLFFGLVGTAAADVPISIRIDGQLQALSKPPAIVQGTTLVPVRGLFENLGGRVSWDSATETVTVVKDQIHISLTVGQKTALINGRGVELLVPPQIIDGSTMVPLRVISEALGAEVHWQEASRTVDMTTHVGGSMAILYREPQTLLPLNTYHLATNLIYDSLLRLDEQMRPQPSLAQSYQISSDARVYTFELRQDVKWHDGTPFTAKDVIYTFTTLLHPAHVASTGTWNLKGESALKGKYAEISQKLEVGEMTTAEASAQKLEAWKSWAASGAVQATDGSVRITMDSPTVQWLISFGTRLILPAHLAPADLATLMDSPHTRSPVGTGPYRFAAWVPGQAIKLVRNPEWIRGGTNIRPRIAEIQIQFTSDPGQIAKAVDSGAVDVGLIDSTSAYSLAGLHNIKAAAHPYRAYTFLGYNLKDPLFNDARVRQAITHAIDRNLMIESLLRGYGQVAHTNQVPGRWDYTADVPRFDYNPDAARQLLDEAGWKMGPNGVRERDGVPLRFEIAVNDYWLPERVAFQIQSQLHSIGMDVTVSVMDWDSFYTHIRSSKKQAYVYEWINGTEPSGYNLFHTKGSWNFLHYYSNPLVDRAQYQAHYTAVPSQRLPLLQDTNRVVAQEQVLTWLFHSDQILVHSPRVQGISSDRMGAGNPFWNIETWYIDGSAQ